ncbi:DMT family transporter [Caenimonas sp. SL110]|uniref:DMT family transporter n=1 Tax=Caenimonas sp. SL110 TaxID=1450524 RepID=UPI0006544BD5|nr:DMT family transporter [Caenimonas sp. SL110]
MTERRQRVVAYACLALSMSLVGSYVALSKPLVAAIPVFLLAWMRFGIGGLGMLPWLRKPADEPPMTRETRRLLFLESFLGNFMFSICMLFGVSMTSAVSAGVIMAAIPAVVALMSWGFLGERIMPRVWAAIACAAAGIALLGLAKPLDHAGATVSALGPAWLGNLLILGAVICEAAYAVIGKKLTGAMGAKRIASLINLWGFALVTPFGLYAATTFDFGGVKASIWILLIFYSLAASIWTVWLWMTGLKTVPASQGGVFTVMLPVSAAVVGVLVLGEPLTTVQVVAFALALAGVALATLPSRSTF